MAVQSAQVSRERYAVVSCHVERPLDNGVWACFSALQEARPGGFAIAALMRPADAAFGEDESAWAKRAGDAARRAPLGHHAHWTAPDHARPTTAPATDRHEAPGARVDADGRRLKALGLAPTVFCGGGWYTDADVAEACAGLGYVDCTPRASRPPYLADGERWAEARELCVVDLPFGRQLSVIPTTHSLGDLARALTRRELPQLVHVYFHDTDLLDRKRALALAVGLRHLALRRPVADLDELRSASAP